MDSVKSNLPVFDYEPYLKELADIRKSVEQIDTRLSATTIGNQLKRLCRRSANLSENLFMVILTALFRLPEKKAGKEIHLMMGAVGDPDEVRTRDDYEPMKNKDWKASGKGKERER